VLLAVAAAATLGPLATVIAGLAGLVAVVAGVILSISLYVRYSLAVQACIIEDIPVNQALKRSVFLAKGSRSRILTVYTVFLLLQMVMALTLGFGFGLLTNSFHSVQLTQAAGALAGFVAGVLTGPLGTVAMSLVYYDERVRKEAFDLQLMMAALDGPSAGMAASAS
jgi:uncharacterized membrane protein YagU involved in acid resistance